MAQIEKNIALLERQLKEAKTNRERGELRRKINSLKEELTTKQKKEELPKQRKKIKQLKHDDFVAFINSLKQKPEYSFLKNLGGKKIQDDYRVVGKKPGWRIKGKGNYAVPSAKFRRENPDLVYFENRINRSDVYRPNRLAKGGNMAKNYGKFGKENSKLVKFNIDDLDPFELMQFKNFEKSLGKAEALQMLINTVEGDYTQLSDKLASIAEEQLPSSEIDDYNRTDYYLSGGKMEKGGSTKISNEKSLLYHLQHHASSGSIANQTKFSNYKDVDAIRLRAIRTLRTEGDKEYSVKNFNEIIAKAAEEYQEELYERQFQRPDMAKGGIVVTKISQIPDLEKKIMDGKVTYRGLGMGKQANDFYKLTNDTGYKLKVDGKEFYVTEAEFEKVARDKQGKMRIKFAAPFRKFEDGGVMEDGGKTESMYSDDEKQRSLKNYPTLKF